MNVEKRQYYEENDYDEVKGFTVLATSEEHGVHVAEKWLKDEGDDVWIDYWVPQSEFEARQEREAITLKGKLTEEQYQTVCEKVEWYTEETFEEVTA